MKAKVPLPVAVAAVVLVIAVAAFAWFRLAANPQGTAAGGPPPAPPSVASQIQKYTPSGDAVAPGRDGPPAGALGQSGRAEEWKILTASSAVPLSFSQKGVIR